MKLNQMLPGVLYKLEFTHDEWNGVEFEFIKSFGEYYEVNIVRIEITKDEYYSDLKLGVHKISHNSAIGQSGKVNYLGTKEDNPEFYL